MGQDQSSALVPARPLPGTSTLRDLCEVDYTVTYESSDDVGMVVNALKCLGFVLVKNVFEPHELAEIQPTVGAMIEECTQRAPGGSENTSETQPLGSEAALSSRTTLT